MKGGGWRLGVVMMVEWACVMTDSFAYIPTIPFARLSTFRKTTKLRMSLQDNGETSTPIILLNRRDILSIATATATTTGLSTLSSIPALAEEENGIGTDPAHPVAIIGANGKTGSICVKLLAQKQLYARGISRSGKASYDIPADYATFASGDVTNYESIRSAIDGASGVIFAASASKKGGDAAHVDYLGLYHTAKACLDCDIPKLVVISSGAVTRPDSIGFKATNLFVGGNIMGYKIAGENQVRDLYSSSSKKLAYTILRPGGLSDGKSIGATGVEVSQGDILSSEIPRTDVAEVCIAAVRAGSSTDFVTIEVNGSAGETMFGQKTGMVKLSKELPDIPESLVHTSSTYEGLFDGLLTDAKMKSTMGDIISNYGGGNIASIASLE